MVTLTERAERVLKRKVFKGKDKSPIRIFKKNGGCGGPRLGVGLDEPMGSDDIFHANGYTFVIDKALHQMTQGITLDYEVYGTRTGFKAIPEVPLINDGCGSCRC